MVGPCFTDRIECQNGHDKNTAQSMKESSAYRMRERIDYSVDYGLGCRTTYVSAQQLFLPARTELHLEPGIAVPPLSIDLFQQRPPKRFNQAFEIVTPADSIQLGEEFGSAPFHRRNAMVMYGLNQSSLVSEIMAHGIPVRRSRSLLHLPDRNGIEAEFAEQELRCFDKSKASRIPLGVAPGVRGFSRFLILLRLHALIPHRLCKFISLLSYETPPVIRPLIETDIPLRYREWGERKVKR